MCGKDKRLKKLVITLLGSPPHVREGQSVNLQGMQSSRITPACAGRTIMELNQFSLSRDHPRSRGKDLSKLISLSMFVGSPPLAREGLTDKTKTKFKSRITPARAGRTDYCPFGNYVCQDHPRSRGKDFHFLQVQK